LSCQISLRVPARCACAAVLLLIAFATVVLAHSPAGAASPGTVDKSTSASSPGTLIGPTHERSVSFLVLLRSTARPSCLVEWAAAERLDVLWDRGQRWASISGAPRDVDRGFHVAIEDYRTSSGKVVFAADHPAEVPSSVCGEISGVGSIRSPIPPTRLDVPQGGATSADLLRAYDALPLTDAGFNGQGETVVLFEYEGGFLSNDFKTFDADEKLPALSPTLVGKNAGFESETTMDLETVHELAPQAHLVFFDLNSVKTSSTADQFAQAITDAAGRWPGAIMSISLGVCEAGFNGPDLVALNAAVATAEKMGTTVFAASGDNGGLDCTPDADAGKAPESSFAGVSVPASLPAVTGTGGTSLTTDAAGTYIGETTWSEPLLSQGSGGGVSAFARPAWQTGPGTGGQIDTGDGREVPDVSADADPTTGNFIIQNGKEQVGGGTSLAAPIWAGFTAIIDQYLKASHDPPVGFFNPALYDLANSSVPYPPFHDITEGGNDLYPATPGYDMVTGLGSPNVYNLARDLKAGSF